MTDFGLQESFDCDDPDAFAGMTPAQIFTLGYEFAVVCLQMEANEHGYRPIVNLENQARIDKAASKRNRKTSWKFSAEDISETWAELRWEPLEL